jgi:hypothetical protein
VELAHCMGWTRLRVVGELAPGVATLAVGDRDSLRLTIKPGSYVWPDAVQEPGRLKWSMAGASSLPAGLPLQDDPGKAGRSLGSLQQPS